MKGETVVINGERWTIVDVAPAAELAEMVAALLEDEGFVAMTRGPGLSSDALTHLGTHSIGTSYVLVPEQEAERAQRVIEETVTDFEGDDLDALLEEIAASGLSPDEFLDQRRDDAIDADAGDADADDDREEG
jgi:hypothetical protein